MYKNGFISELKNSVLITVDSKDKTLVYIDNITKVGLDIGPKTIESIKERINSSKVVFVNGPAGAFENETFAYGTKELFTMLSNMEAKVIIGGGDAASAARSLGYADKFSLISTGGGATLDYIINEKITALEEEVEIL